MTFQEELTSLKNRIEAVEAQTEKGYIITSRHHTVEVKENGWVKACIKTDYPYIFATKKEAAKVAKSFKSYYTYEGKQVQIKWKVVTAEEYRISRIAELKYVYSVFEKAIEAQQ